MEFEEFLQLSETRQVGKANWDEVYEKFDDGMAHAIVDVVQYVKEKYGTNGVRTRNVIKKWVEEGRALVRYKGNKGYFVLSKAIAKIQGATK